MNALKMHAVDRPPAARGADHSAVLEADAVCLAPRMKAALATLLEAIEYAQDLSSPAWDFAIEISVLRRLRLSNSDLRWLVARGLAEHAVEITPRNDSQRIFRQGKRLVIGKRSCFTLTSAGAELAHELREGGDGHGGRRLPATVRDARLDPASPLPRAPKWDRDRQELRVGTIVVKRFTIPSASQETVLAAFEEQDWPQRIDDPLPPRDELSRKTRLQETIRSLNLAQKQPLVDFIGDGSGQGILWEFRGDLAALAGHRGHDE